jgi:hypothetical protein
MRMRVSPPTPRAAHPVSCRVRLLVAGILTVFLLPVIGHAAGPVAPDVAFRLELMDALPKGEPTPGSPALFMDLARIGGSWERVWGNAPRFNVALHEGLVTEASIGSDAMDVSVSLLMGSDAWVKGGRARYRAVLRKTAEGVFEGEYTGSLRDIPLKGIARARLLPVPAPFALDPAEHPRLLFRKADLPALRAKAATPFGKAALEKMDGVVGRALKYQLTGDRAHVEAILPQIEAMLGDNGVGDKLVRGRILGWRFEQLALAYDLCFDALPEELKRRIEAYVTGPEGWRAFARTSTFQKEIQWHPTAIYPPNIRYGPALAALAVWGMKGPAPVKPDAPLFLHDPPVPEIAPATGYQPAAGMPVVAFTDGAVPRDWLCAGGFPGGEGNATLAGFEVAAELQAAPGLAVKINGRERAFRPLTAFYKDSIAVTDAAGREFFTGTLFATVLDNDRPRTVRLTLDNRVARAWINGTELRDGDAAMLGKGLYPVIVAAWTGQQSQWGNDLIAPRFREITESEAVGWIEEIRAERGEQLRVYEADLAQWERMGGADLQALRLFELSRNAMRVFFRDAVGHGGFQDAPLPSFEGPVKYAAAHRAMFGVDVAPDAGLPQFLARKLFTMVWDGAGAGVGVEVDGTEGFRSKRFYIEPSYDLAPNFFSALYPLTPREWQPSVLWGWRRQLGIGGPGDAAKALANAGRPTTGYPWEAQRALTFVNYPADAPDRAPQGTLPLTWRADDHGWYGFRNTWEGSDAFITQVSLRRGSNGGEAAGAFRVRGLGHDWALGGSVMRLFENVVQLPDDTLNEKGRGALLGHTAAPDGSGSVTLDLGDVYAAPSPGLYENFGGIRVPANLKPSGITGSRSIAVDYSGKSGVPCLLVVADRVQGGKAKVWAWPSAFRSEVIGGKFAGQPAFKDLSPEGKKYADFTQAEMKEIHRRVVAGSPTPRAESGGGGTRKPRPETKENPEDADEGATEAGADSAVPVIEGDTFTIRKGDAVLHATLVRPARAKFAVEELERFTMGAKYTLVRYTCTAVTARGEGDFLAVVTIGRGEAPRVEPTAAGATVGGQSVRLDAGRVIIDP